MIIQRQPASDSRRSSLWLRLGAVAAVTAALILALPQAAAQSDSEIPDGTPPDFRSCGELDARLTELATDALVQRILFGVGRRPNRNMLEAMDIGGGGGGQALPVIDRAFAPRDYTTTNVQEDGVDELDVIETDGEYIYALQDGVLHIVDSWPPEDAAELAQIELEGWGESIFLVGDVVVAFTSIYEGGYGYYGYGDGYGDTPPSPRGPRSVPTRVAVIDVATPTRPSIAHTFEIEGGLLGARAVAGTVYFAVKSNSRRLINELVEEVSDLGLPEIPDDPTDEELARLRRQITELVTPLVADWVATKGRAALIPDVRVDGGEREEMLSCSEIYEPSDSAQFSMTSIVGLDVDEGDLGGVGVLAKGWITYASTNAFYIAQDSRWWWWPNPESKYTETNIHQFDLNDGDPIYLASGTVPGWVLNQFSMSEYDGFLRVATTDQTIGGWDWGVEEGSNVFVLAQEGQLLEIVGEVRRIAPGDDLKAILCRDERCYLATAGRSRRDSEGSLVTLDLSDPDDPQVEGELHITGFNTYLHPFGDDLLIGLGREHDDRGRVLGLQLQLFDVTDMANPTRIYQEPLSMGEAGWGFSEAEHDHRAFTFWLPDGTPENLLGYLAIPVTLEDWTWDSDDYKYFSGIVVYEISVEDGFVGQGKVRDPRPRRKILVPRRAVFVGEGDGYLYALSNMGLTVSSLDAIEVPVATIEFEDPRDRRRR
jgi:hypothetical protein